MEILHARHYRADGGCDGGGLWILVDERLVVETRERPLGSGAVAHRKGTPALQRGPAHGRVQHHRPFAQYQEAAGRGKRGHPQAVAEKIQGRPEMNWNDRKLKGFTQRMMRYYKTSIKAHAVF